MRMVSIASMIRNTSFGRRMALEAGAPLDSLNVVLYGVHSDVPHRHQKAVLRSVVTGAKEVPARHLRLPGNAYSKRSAAVNISRRGMVAACSENEAFQDESDVAENGLLSCPTVSHNLC